MLEQNMKMVSMEIVAMYQNFKLWIGCYASNSVIFYLRLVEMQCHSSNKVVT